MSNGAENGGGLSEAALYRASQHSKVLESVPKDHVIVLVVCAPILDGPGGKGYAMDLAMKVAADSPLCRPSPATLVAALVKAWCDTVWEKAVVAATPRIHSV
jgi:hypothetical protein